MVRLYHPIPKDANLSLKIPVSKIRVQVQSQTALFGRDNTGTQEADGGRRADKRTQTPHPPLAERAQGLSAPIKFAPYFSTNLFQCNTILQKREIGLGNPEGDKKRSQENVEKRGILGGIGASEGASRA